MSIHLRAHAFAANPLRGLASSASTAAVSSSAAADALRALLDGAGTAAHHHLSKVLPFRRGRPLARSPDPPAPSPSSSSPAPPPAWRLAWLPPSRVPGVPSDVFVFLGSHGGDGESKEVTAYWAVDVSEVEGAGFGGAGEESAFVDLRTLMVAADWRDKDAMGELAIAGHVRAVFLILALTIKMPMNSRTGIKTRLI
jgi:NAD+ diphosphatase